MHASIDGMAKDTVFSTLMELRLWCLIKFGEFPWQAVFFSSRSIKLQAGSNQTIFLVLQCFGKKSLLIFQRLGYLMTDVRS